MLVQPSGKTGNSSALWRSHLLVGRTGRSAEDFLRQWDDLDRESAQRGKGKFCNQCRSINRYWNPVSVFLSVVTLPGRSGFACLQEIQVAGMGVCDSGLMRMGMGHQHDRRGFDPAECDRKGDDDPQSPKELVENTSQVGHAHNAKPSCNAVFFNLKCRDH